MSTRIKQTLPVPCPYVRAKQYLSDAIEKGELGHALVLKAKVAKTGIELDKTVNARYALGADPMHFDEPWDVAWRPVQGALYPSFEGTLTVRADDNYRSCLLEIEGSYTPPFGPAGAAFDGVVGRHIAAQSMQTMLQTIAKAMMDRYQAEERAK